MLLNKKYVKQETRIQKYGSDSVAVVAMDFNRRFIAAFLALVFVITTLVVGYNFAAKATTGDQIIIDDTFGKSNIALGSFESRQSAGFLQGYETTNMIGNISFTVTDGIFTSISGGTNIVNLNNNQRLANINIGTTLRPSYPDYASQYDNGTTQLINDLQSLIGQPATYENAVAAIIGYSGSNTRTQSGYETVAASFLEVIRDAPQTPAPIIDGDDYEAPDPPPLPDSAESYLEVNKTIAPSQDGSAYDLTLEAYSTADISSYEIMEKVPTDYVIVIDQSGSMAYSDMPTSYKAAGNKTLEEINEGNYYINVGGKTYRVFAERGYLFDYHEANSIYAGDIAAGNTGWFRSERAINLGLESELFYNPFLDGATTDETENIFHQVRIGIKNEELFYAVRLLYDSNTENNIPLSPSTTPKYKNYTTITGWNDYPPGAIGYDAVNGLVQGWASLFGGWTRGTFLTYGEIVGQKAGMYVRQTLFTRHVGYTRLCYRDDNGVLQEVPTKDGVYSTVFSDDNGNAITTKDGSTRMEYSGLLEGKTYESRLDTLETALQAFAKTLEKDRDSFGIVDNRVAIVGFSSPNSSGNNYNNTEVLSGVTLTPVPATSGSTGDSPYFPYGYNYNGPQYYANNGNYGSIDAAYGTALIDATVEGANGEAAVNPDLYSAIHALTAYGGTQPEDGLVMAKSIYDNRDETTYTMRSGTKETVERNKVVIFFTDGQPGDYENSNRYLEANQVVDAAYDLKHYKNPGENTENPAQIFSIGVFGTSDGEALTYEAHAPTEETKAYEYDAGYYYTYDSTARAGWWGGTTTTYHYLNRFWHPGEQGYPTQADDTIYDYMSTVSSRYPDATAFVDSAWDEQGTNSRTYEAMVSDVRGTEDTSKNYYRLAANQESLIAAFRSAVAATAGEIPPAAGEISPDTVLKDFINTTNFNLPNNPVIEVKTLVGTKTGDQAPVFPGTEGDSSDITATANGNVITVSGFDYNDKHIASNHPGEKLVVTIKGITPKAGVTGDQLLSNTDETGIYSDDTAEADMLKAFPEPAIARYKYELNVDAADTDAVFDLDYTLAANQGVTPDWSNILISTDTGRELYSAGNIKSQNDVGNGSAVYLEYITEQGGNGVVDPADYSLTTTIVPTSPDASSYTYYLDTTNYVDLNNPDSTKVLPQPNGTTVTSLSTTQNGALFVDSVTNNRDVTFHLTADESPFVDEDYKFKVDITLTGTNIADKIAALNAENSNITFSVGDDNNTIVGTLEITRGSGETIPPVTIKVPDGATLAVGHTDPFYTTEYISEDEDGDPEYQAHAITTSTDIYILDTVNNDVGAGIQDNTDSAKVLIIILAGAGIVSAGAGVAYVYRRKDDFGEQ